jgi:chromosome partitioning protein
MIISVTNLKGGVGKTTLSINLAVAFAHKGKKVCLVDLDEGQKSAMVWGENRAEAKKEPFIKVETQAAKQLFYNIPNLQENFDLIIIDGCPTLAEVQSRIIWASDIVLIPVRPSELDYRSFEQFLEQYDRLAADRANTRKIQGYVIMNGIVAKSLIAKNVETALSHYEQLPMLKTRLAQRLAYAESVSDGVGVIEYKDEKAKAEMQALANELETIINTF